MKNVKRKICIAIPVDGESHYTDLAACKPDSLPNVMPNANAMRGNSS